MLNIRVGNIRKQVSESFHCFIQKTWKLMLPLIVVMTYMDQQEMEGNNINSVLIFLIVLVSFIQAALTIVLPFKAVQFLNRFYKEPEKEYPKKRFFIILFSYLAITIVYIVVAILYVLFFYKKLYYTMEIPVIMLSAILIFLLWIGLFFLSLTPMIYWDNQKLTLMESCKISIRGVKKYFWKILFFAALIPFLCLLLVVAVSMFFYFFLPHHLVVILESFLKNFGYWIYFAYSTGILYLFAKLAQEKNDIFRQGEEAVEVSEIQEEDL